MTIFCTIQFDNLAGSLAALVLTATTFPMVRKNESAEFPLKMALSQPSQLAQLFIRKLCNFIGDSFGSLTKCYYLLITWKESAKLYIYMYTPNYAQASNLGIQFLRRFAEQNRMPNNSSTYNQQIKCTDTNT